MYKVFLNERMIKIEAPSKTAPNEQPFLFSKSCSETEVKEWFSSFLNNNLKAVIIQHPDPKHFLNLFESIFKLQPAAGGVVKSGAKILFIFRNGKWDLPKGKIEKGESVEKAAVREVEEECGILGHTIVKKLPSTYHIYKSTYKKSEGTWIFKETYWFEMEYSGESSGSPETREGITKLRWFMKTELDEVLSNTYENLKQIVNIYRD